MAKFIKDGDSAHRGEVYHNLDFLRKVEVEEDMITLYFTKDDRDSFNRVDIVREDKRFQRVLDHIKDCIE